MCRQVYTAPTPRRRSSHENNQALKKSLLASDITAAPRKKRHHALSFSNELKIHYLNKCKETQWRRHFMQEYSVAQEEFCSEWSTVSLYGGDRREGEPAYFGSKIPHPTLSTFTTSENLFWPLMHDTSSWYLYNAKTTERRERQQMSVTEIAKTCGNVWNDVWRLNRNSVIRVIRCLIQRPFFWYWEKIHK
jgi:hypothetical protein